MPGSGSGSGTRWALETSDDEVSRERSREASEDEEGSEKSPEHDKPEGTDHLKEHYASRKRLDRKETTLTLRH